MASSVVNRPVVEKCQANVRTAPNGKPLMRVCVLTSSYVGSESELKDVDDIERTPAHFFPPAPGAPSCDSDEYEYIFEEVPLTKKDSYVTIRRLIKSGKYDVFFNLCDGCKEEDRAGAEVVAALEEFKAPFTGSNSKYYEISKPDQKMWAHYSRIRSAKYAFVEDPSEIRRKCRHLKFPVIVKHYSGYSSVGMTKDCCCENMETLVTRATLFMETYQFALIEEFIIGDEVTVLACADSTQPDGVRVYPPVRMTFPEGENFKHFDLKWQGYDGMGWHLLPQDHPSYDRIIDIGRKSFKVMMGGVGYGRTDLRIEASTGDPVFLELNTNCGVMYPPDQEGSADWILRLSTGHQAFTKLQITEALAIARKLQPIFACDYDEAKGYYIKAKRDIRRGELLFEEEGRPFRLFTKQYVEANWDSQMKEWFQSSAWPLSPDQHVYAIWDIDPNNWRPFNHSCDPNMAHADGRSLNIIACRDVPKGDELTMDYATFCDSTMPDFDCNCGASTCRGRIYLDQTPALLKDQSWHKSPPRTMSHGLTPNRISPDSAVAEEMNHGC